MPAGASNSSEAPSQSPPTTAATQIEHNSKCAPLRLLALHTIAGEEEQVCELCSPLDLVSTTVNVPRRPVLDIGLWNHNPLPLPTSHLFHPSCILGYYAVVFCNSSSLLYSSTFDHKTPKKGLLERQQFRLKLVLRGHWSCTFRTRPFFVHVLLFLLSTFSIGTRTWRALFSSATSACSAHCAIARTDLSDIAIMSVILASRPLELPFP